MGIFYKRNVPLPKVKLHQLSKSQCVCVGLASGD